MYAYLAHVRNFLAANRLWIRCYFIRLGMSYKCENCTNNT